VFKRHFGKEPPLLSTLWNDFQLNEHTHVLSLHLYCKISKQCRVAFAIDFYPKQPITFRNCLSTRVNAMHWAPTKSYFKGFVIDDEWKTVWNTYIQIFIKHCMQHISCIHETLYHATKWLHLVNNWVIKIYVGVKQNCVNWI